MNHALDVILVKEYVQTLTNGEVSFPGVVSRPWGGDFDQSEQAIICQSLHRLCCLAHPKRYSTLIERLKAVTEPDHLPWLPISFWLDIAALIQEEHIRHL